MRAPMIIANNVLIAAFMGEPAEKVRYAFEKEYPQTAQRFCYHTDFNLLIAVVEKIEKMDYGFKMCRKRVEVYVDSTKEVLINVKEDCRLNSLYKAVVEFIKLYNEKAEVTIPK